MTNTPLNKRAKITNLLRDAILSGHLKPGTRLPEIRLGRELGVSQAIVREALQELEGLGLIAKRLQQGSYVIELDADDLVHIYQVRSELESLACVLATQSFQQTIYNQLQECIVSMRTAAVNNDFLAYSRADVAFHRLMWAFQPNRFLERSLEAICLPLFAYDQIRRADSTALDYERVTRQHELILSAMRTGDSERVGNLMRRMMRRWLRIHLSEYVRISQQNPVTAKQEADTFAYLRSQAQQLFAESTSESTSESIS